MSDFIIKYTTADQRETIGRKYGFTRDRSIRKHLREERKRRNWELIHELNLKAEENKALEDRDNNRKAS